MCLKSGQNISRSGQKKLIILRSNEGYQATVGTINHQLLSLIADPTRNQRQGDSIS